ncbi:MAG: hypothetical protein AAF446_09250, partial [Pseudomonadota bacterium]
MRTAQCGCVSCRHLQLKAIGEQQIGTDHITPGAHEKRNPVIQAFGQWLLNRYGENNKNHLICMHLKQITSQFC